MLDTVASGERRHVNGDASTTTANGDVRIVEFHATNLLHDPAVAAIVVNIRDVTERRRLEARLIHDARHDSLTGLPNRAMLGELLDQHLSEVSRRVRSEEHTSELQSLMRISYAVFCLKKKTTTQH